MSLSAQPVMNLTQLLQPFVAQGWVDAGLPELENEGVAPIKVSGLTLDSRAVQTGDVFVAMPGLQVDGRDYIDAALANGAVAVLVEAQGFAAANDAVAPVIPLDNLQDKLGAIAARFYGEPSHKLDVIGITGTNGKTSCSQFIAEALTEAGQLTGVIGTLGFGLPGQLQSNGFTTPDAIAVQSALAELKTQQVQSVAMEVSSHALEQGRVNQVAFETAIFTNLTRDHLDYHGDMSTYGAAKQRLFLVPGLKQAILNVDDAFGRHLYEQLNNDVTCYRYCLADQGLADEGHEAEVVASNVQLSEQGIEAQLTSPWGDGVLRSHLLGRFNVSNLLAVYTTLCVHGLSHEQALTALGKLAPVAGRMQTLGGNGQPLVLVDFAHTPDALASVLRTARELTEDRLWCVFGCGGNRDAGKRPLMGEVAAEFADEVVATSDNPRNEDPDAIIEQILAGISGPVALRVNADREAAIRAAVFNANAGDVVVVAGKGHEDYQEVQGVKQPFSDVQQVEQALSHWCEARGVEMKQVAKPQDGEAE